MDERDLRSLLSKNIRRYRAYRKFSQAELAEKLDISVPFLSDIENGKKWVSPRTLAKMADTFNVEAFELLRPEHDLPDHAVNILEKYTAEIYSNFGKALDSIQGEYIARLVKK
jgi:transcriptional regulator with XRE-family HTH domain